MLAGDLRSNGRLFVKAKTLFKVSAHCLACAALLALVTALFMGDEKWAWGDVTLHKTSGFLGLFLVLATVASVLYRSSQKWEATIEEPGHGGGEIVD